MEKENVGYCANYLVYANSDASAAVESVGPKCVASGYRSIEALKAEMAAVLQKFLSDIKVPEGKLLVELTITEGEDGNYVDYEEYHLLWENGQISLIINETGLSPEEESSFKELFSKYCRAQVNAGHCAEGDCGFCPVNGANEKIFEKG